MSIPAGYVSTGTSVNCPQCGGQGYIQQTINGQIYAVQCPTCAGTGKIDIIAPAS